MLQAFDPEADFGRGWRLALALGSFTAATSGWMWTAASYLGRA